MMFLRGARCESRTGQKMADKLFELEIVSPDRVFYRGQASMVEMSTTEGEIGVYAGHIPMTNVLKPGILQY